MRVPAFNTPGRFWRGNLHTHSNHSDGALSPAETVARYQDAGYDFVVVTDHFRSEYGFPVTDTTAFRSPSFTSLLGAELHAPGPELGSEWHIVAVGLPLDFSPPAQGEDGPALARRARRAGAFVGMAHPSASLLTETDAEALDAAHAVEAYNALAVAEERGDSWPFADVLLSKGRQVSAFAADDAHFQPQDPPGCAAWVHVRAVELTPVALLAALKAGHYYSSTGPNLTSVTVTKGHVEVECSPARQVLVTGGRPGKQSAEGESLTQARLPVSRYAGTYFRVTVVDTYGGRAWTNPIHLPTGSMK
ncbi:MAG: CehA/McbA family metallohydrolase [Actinomycetota bacterium]